MVGANLEMRVGHEVVGANDECLAFCGTQIPKSPCSRSLHNATCDLVE